MDEKNEQDLVETEIQSNSSNEESDKIELTEEEINDYINVEEVKDLIFDELENKNYNKVKELLTSLLVPDIASILNEIDSNIVLVKIFKLLPKDLGAEVFAYVDTNVQEEIVSAMSDAEIAYLIEEMYIDDAADLVDEMPANVANRILKNSTSETRATINRILRYEEDSAGSVMTTEFVDLKEDFTISDALKKIRKEGNNVEQISVLYVTDNQRILKGVVTIKDILLNEPTTLIKDIMDENVVYETTDCDQEVISQTFSKYDIIALPICDTEKRLLGIVTVDDAVEIMEEEATEDISILKAVNPSDEVYLKTSVFRFWLNRIPWLIVLMLASSITAAIIKSNEDILNASRFGIILTACIPMLMDAGGNTGGQSSATVMRALALNEITFSDILRVIWKELRIAILVGITLFVVCYFKLLYIDGIAQTESGYLVAAVVCLGLCCTVILSKLVGSILPLLAKKVNLDPAVMASPVITTIIDALSLLVLCTLALNLLPN